MNKTIVIYHRADFDGIFCREIAKKFLPDADLIGWDYGDPLIPEPQGTYYVLDLSPDCVQPNGTGANLIWIDHHKSAIDKFSKDILGYRIDGVAACRLAWQWFEAWGRYLQQTNPGMRDLAWFCSYYPFPKKDDFTERKVSEPFAVRLAGEYDIWDKRDPNAELFQHGLRSRDLTNDWRLLLTLDRRMSVSEIEGLIDIGHDKDLLRPDGTTPNPLVLGLLENGRCLQYAKTQENESIIKAAGFTIQFEGLTFLACNHARYNSFLFTAGLTPEHDACFGFCWRDNQWTVSLYHAPGKEQHDLSAIAVKYGGGGHRGAAGMRMKTLPFLSLKFDKPAVPTVSFVNE